MICLWDTVEKIQKNNNMKKTIQHSPSKQDVQWKLTNDLTNAWQHGRDTRTTFQFPYSVLLSTYRSPLTVLCIMPLWFANSMLWVLVPDFRECSGEESVDISEGNWKYHKVRGGFLRDRNNFTAKKEEDTFRLRKSISFVPLVSFGLFCVPVVPLRMSTLAASS